VKPFIEHIGDYQWVEIRDDDGVILIRVGFDHEPTQEEMDALIQQLLAPPPSPPPPEEVLTRWQF
jgi:hypothetical protein